VPNADPVDLVDLALETDLTEDYLYKSRLVFEPELGRDAPG
jgi:hypothetical protein